MDTDMGHKTQETEAKIPDEENCANGNQIEGTTADEKEEGGKEEDGITTDNPSTGAEHTSPKLEVDTNPTHKIPSAIDFSSAKTWSEMIQSPKIPEFSPSLNPNRPGSLHGLGLKLALERSKSTGLFCRDVHNFIVGVATIYDHYGTTLVKISQMVRPGRLPFEGTTVLDDDFKGLYECMKQFGDRFRTLAEFFRSAIANSVKQTLSDTTKTVETCNDRYQRVRSDSFQSRQSANALLKKYVNAVQAVEAELQVWMKESSVPGKDVEADTNIERKDSDSPNVTPWEKALARFGETNPEGTARLVKKLKAVLALEAEYQDAVHKEHNKIALSEEMEVVALGKIQEAEQDRISLLATSVVTKVFLGEIDVETKNLPTPLNIDDSTFGFEKKGMDLLAGLNAGLFKQASLPYEPGMGLMEAETMGLPAEFGTLRDEMKKCFGKHEKRIKATQTIYKLLEEVEELASQSSSALTIRTQAQVGNQTENSFSGSVLGSRSGHLWLETVNTFQYESKLISDVAFACKRLRNPKVESWMANAPRNLKNEMDLDDAAWKLVADTTRAEMKSESRYKQSKDQADKSRSRALSRGDMSSGSHDSSDRPASAKTDNSATDAPNSPFRLFKGRGEAMKLFQEKALGQITDDQREEKDKIAFEEASSAKKEAVMAYKAYTTTRMQKFESQDSVGWDELKGIIEEILKTVSTLRQARQETLRTKVIEETKTSFPLLPADLDDWAKTVKERILQKEKSLPSEGSTEYSLTIKSTETENAKKILAMSESDKSLPIKPAEKSEATSPLQSLSVPSSKSFDSANDPRLKSTQTLTPEGAKSNTTNPAAAQPGEAPSKLQQSASKPESSSRELNVQAFKKAFWSKKTESEEPPKILEIFTCSYRPKEKSAFLTPNLQGRCFTTSESIYFLSWDNKSFVLKWDAIMSVEKEKGFMGSASDNSLAVTYSSEGSNSAFTFSRLDAGDQILRHLQSLLNGKKSKARSASETTSGSDGPPVPPDALLKEMEIVVSKNIKGTNIKSVYEKAWADPSGQKSFYGAWLEDEECFDITVGDWEYAEKDTSFTNPWCGKKGETYTQKRLVTFKFKRTTHLYIGPPVAFVKQMHYVRVEGDDKIILAIEATFEGIPYSDTFGVEMRWVASRVGTNEVKVQVGLFVLFKKGTMLKSQIKAGTISETKNVHVRLFNAVKKACTVPGEASAEEDADEEEDIEVTKEGKQGMLATLGEMIPSNATSAIVVIAAILVGRYFMTSAFGTSGHTEIARLELQVGQLQEEVRSLRESVALLVDLLNKKGR
ncbi:MAG: hypothetical protein SGILL_006294 [Bacillariaceae sp.]